MKVTLKDVRKMVNTGFFVDVPQPEFCYHYSTKENIEKILQDGKVRTMGDYMTYFFYTPEDIPKYLDLTGALTTGRKYYDLDGKIHKAPPLIPENCAVLKLYPTRKESLTWYEERNQDKAKTEAEKELAQMFDAIRVLHYGDFSFKREPEIIELSEIISKYPYSRPEHLKPH